MLVSAGRAEIRRVTGSIVNGVVTAELPATGALLSGVTPGSAALFCSGTMIGCRTFLTAGHCVEDSVDPADYFVYLQHGGLFSVASVAVHSDYAFPEADVAVLTLQEAVTAIRPVPIDLLGGHAVGTPGTIAGFGEIGGSASDAGLKRIGTVSLSPCSGSVSNTTSICWNFENPVGAAGEDSNTCSGDSGGPLFVATGSGDVVAGVTSGGSATDCLAPDTSFDARVSFYAGWIAGEGGADLASTVCGAGPQVGDAGATVVAFDGTVSAPFPEGRHTVMVPAAATELRVTMNGVDDGSDFDLYVKHGAPPTTSDFDCAQAGGGQFGACTFSAPDSGPWHLLVLRSAGSGAYQATATILRGVCDPADEGLPCDDADACTSGETCQSGVCTGGAVVGCDDGVTCTVDTCHPAAGCQHAPDHGACAPCGSCDPGDGCVGAPRTDCRHTMRPRGAKLKAKDAANDNGDLLLWKLTRAEAIDLTELGDPTTSDAYRLCLYDESGPTSVEVLRADVPAGGTCDGKPCWRPSGTRGFKYVARDGAPEGVSKLVLRAGAAGRTKVVLRAKGTNLAPLPATPFGLPLRVQLHAAVGTCWESTFTNAGTSRNEGGLFAGRGD